MREMAEELNLTARQVKSIMDTLNAAKGIDSLTTLVNEEETTTLEDLISDDGKGNPHDVFVDNETQASIKRSLDSLDDRDRAIVVMRYGLEDNAPKTLGEVAELLSLSRERVRQIEERAIHTLRMAAYRAGIIEMHTENFRTQKLHSAMRRPRRVNILGEEIDNDPLTKMIRTAQKEQKKKHSAKKVHKKTIQKVSERKTQKKISKKAIHNANPAVKKKTKLRRSVSKSHQKNKKHSAKRIVRKVSSKSKKKK